MNKRIISLLLTAVMLFTLLPAAAFASEPEIIESGSCGANITWTLSSDGVLTLSGSGRMYDYNDIDYDEKAPWTSNACYGIRKIVIEDGITYIGRFAFTGCRQYLIAVTIPDSVTEIGAAAFSYCTSLVYVDIGKGVTKIGMNAFEGCSSLRWVVFGKALKTVADGAFEGCRVWGMDVYYPGTGYQCSKIDFNSNDDLKETAKWHYSHVHKLERTTVVPATCTADGYSVYSCSGGASFRDDIIHAPGHKIEVIKGYPATYEKAGLTDGEVCTVCGKTVKKQKTIPPLVDKIDTVTINGLDAPVIGKELDYDFSVTVSGGEIVTEGDSKPRLEWYIFDDDCCDYVLITDAKHICTDARAYAFKLILTPDKHSRFGHASSSSVFSGFLSVNGKNVNEDECTSIDKNEVMSCSYVYKMRSFASSKVIKSFEFEDMPTWFVIGDKVSDFKPAKLNLSAKTASYIWYLEKKNYNHETTALYVPDECMEAFMKLNPTMKKSHITAMRKSFGTTFDNDEAYYTLHNLVKLTDSYCFKAGNGSIEVGILPIGRGYWKTVLSGGDGVSPLADMKIVLNGFDVKTPEVPEPVYSSGGNASMTWSFVPGADKYQIYRATDTESFSRIATTSGNKYTDKSAISGKTYYYKIRAVNTTGGKTYYSDFSKSHALVPIQTPVMTLKYSGGSAKLSWNKIEGANKYEIYRSVDGKSFKLLKSLKGTSYTDSSLTGGSEYSYKVRTVVVVDKSTEKGIFCAKQSITAMAKPTVTLAKTDSGIKLTWKAIDGAAKYQVARSTDNKTFKILKTVTGTSLTNTSVKSGTKYYYKVRPVDAKGNTGAYSAVKSYTILGTPTVTAKQSGTSAALSWTKIAGAEKYSIYRSTDGVSFSLLTTVKTTSFTDKSLTKGSTYYYKVKAATSGNSGSFSEVVSLKIMKTPAITLKGSDGTVKLTWKAIDGAVKYQVYRSTDNKSFKLLSTVKGTSLTNSKVTGGTKYYYKLRAVDENGGVSDFSSVKSIKA